MGIIGKKDGLEGTETHLKKEHVWDGKIYEKRRNWREENMWRTYNSERTENMTKKARGLRTLIYMDGWMNNGDDEIQEKYRKWE